MAAPTRAEVAAHLREVALLERRRMQGHAAATLVVRGEREQVLEIALEEE